LAAIPYTVTFSENVTNFVQADVTVGGGTISNFETSDGITYTFAVIPDDDGEVVVVVAAGVAADAAGNVNTESAPVIRTSDRTAPTAEVETAPGPTNLASIPFTVGFDEDVTGFDAGDIVVLNGTVSDFTATGGDTFFFNVIPTADGDVTVSVPPGAAVDAAGNPSTAAPGATRVSDRTNPTVGVNSTGTAVIAGTSSDATGVVGVQVSISNGTNFWNGTAFASATEMFFAATSTNSFATWSLPFTTTGTFSVHAKATDAAGNIGETTNPTVTVS
jgi:hypothetical protein